MPADPQLGIRGLVPGVAPARPPGARPSSSPTRRARRPASRGRFLHSDRPAPTERTKQHPPTVRNLCASRCCNGRPWQLVLTCSGAQGFWLQSTVVVGSPVSSASLGVFASAKCGLRMHRCRGPPPQNKQQISIKNNRQTCWGPPAELPYGQLKGMPICKNGPGLRRSELPNGGLRPRQATTIGFETLAATCCARSR